MRLSTRTRYGTRAMVELALAYPDLAVPVKDVARKQNLSAKYLEQIMSALKAADLVRSVRGMHGGYALSREPDSITLADVFHVLEGSAAPVDCVDHPEVGHRWPPVVGECPEGRQWSAQSSRSRVKDTIIDPVMWAETGEGESTGLIHLEAAPDDPARPPSRP